MRLWVQFTLFSMVGREAAGGEWGIQVQMLAKHMYPLTVLILIIY